MIILDPSFYYSLETMLLNVEVILQKKKFQDKFR